MGLFKKKKRRASVNVMGLSPLTQDMDGRYGKQLKSKEKRREKKEQELTLDPHTPAELRGYIENTYHVKELEKTDERYKKAYMGVKAHLVERDASEILKTAALPEPDHPPVSADDADYEAWRKNKDARFREAVMLPPDQFKVHLHVYVINITVNEVPVAWLEVYVETVHEYLAFSTIALEYEEHYAIERTKTDIIRFFGASEKDREADNERYRQLISTL